MSGAIAPVQVRHAGSMHRTLLLMRHAEASAGLMGTDAARSLSQRGVHEAREAGERLASLGTVDHALVSTARRTLQTLDGLRAGGLAIARVEERDDVYEASVRALLEAVQTAPDDAATLLVLGHAPGIPGLATMLANDPAAAYPSVRMPKGFAPATVVRLSVDRPWSDLDAGQADVVDILQP